VPNCRFLNSDTAYKSAISCVIDKLNLRRLYYVFTTACEQDTIEKSKMLILAQLHINHFDGFNQQEMCCYAPLNVYALVYYND
jgi:hypothetical protein